MRHRDGKPPEYYQGHFCLLTEHEAIAIGKFKEQEAEARALRDQQAQGPSRVINASGDQFVRVGDYMLISLARVNNMPAFDMVGMTNHQPMPDYQLRALAMAAGTRSRARLARRQRPAARRGRR